MAFVILALAGLALIVGGCGSSNKTPGPLTEEQKRLIIEEDKRVADEESGGTAGQSE
jgi:hypothetical protein